VGLIPDAARWRGRRVLVTGHTGFVGGWLCAWLERLGARVHGFSLDPPTNPSFFEATRLYSRLASSVRGDIRDADALRRAVAQADPQDVFHLAAQPIVREAHRDPAATFSTNVMGTVNVLDACRGQAGLESLIAFTTDKVYRNDGSGRAFEEGDALGGNEPYSASKAACDWAIGTYWESYFRASRTSVAIIRAGNIIGGGDWGTDRLLPDAMRAFSARRPLVLRHPESTRPWQHVLDAVRGTLLLAERDAAGDSTAEDIAWNLGPAAAGETRVSEVADLASRAWGEGAAWRHERDDAIPESRRLRLSSAKAEAGIGWRCAWDAARAVKESVAWYRAHGEGRDVMDLTDRQIAAHEEDAR
jgi:CDP-glucose 4,6-dehydratase